MNTIELNNLAIEYGLVFRGGFAVTPEDLVPAQINGDVSVSLLLFGQTGSSLWPVFSQSVEFSDGLPHPLDRWSKRVGQSMADMLAGRLLLPFGDAPFHPFSRWACRIEDVQPSRLGMLIHPVYGLWHAYRFAIALPAIVGGLITVEQQGSICAKCETQPCLNICPVGAFDGQQYDVQSCSDYLQRSPEAPCHTDGCLARGACPEGGQYHYDSEQIQFHMKQFTLALHTRFSQSTNE